MHDLLHATPPGAHVGDLGNARLVSLAAQGVVLVDIRRSHEWEATGIIPGSHLLTFFDEYGDYDTELWLRELARLAGPDDPVVLICRLGQRTALVGRWLNGACGYGAVMHLAGGITGWLGEGRSVVPAGR